MDPDEPFNPEYYHFVLQSLTLNSRAIITELSTIAERFPEHAEEIVDLIEERIRKCLPQQKLFTIYLLDSICKNVGNPYNLFFGSRLYKIFTESYLVVTDTPTRQDLINLFKTWQGAKTTAGADLFPEPVMQKIEKFIIRATSIGQTPEPQHQSMIANQNGGLLQKLGPNLQNNPQKPSQSFPPLSGPIPPPDSLLREANMLLQTIVALNNSYDEFLKISKDGKEDNDERNEYHDKKIENNNDDIVDLDTIEDVDKKDKRTIIYPDRHATIQELDRLEQERNTLVMNLNMVSESIYLANKQHYGTIAGKLFNDLKIIRTQLDKQAIKQRGIILSYKPIAKIELGTPNETFFASWTLDITQDNLVLQFLENWGKEVHVGEVKEKHEEAEENGVVSTPLKIVDSEEDSPMMERLDLVLHLGSEVSSATEIDTDQDEEELYDPMINFDSDPDEMDIPVEPKSFLFDDTPREPLVSSLKKRRGSTDAGQVVKKKVRFVDDIGI